MRQSIDQGALILNVRQTAALVAPPSSAATIAASFSASMAIGRPPRRPRRRAAASPALTRSCVKECYAALGNFRRFPRHASGWRSPSVRLCYKNGPFVSSGQQTDADRQRRITESFAKAMEQLGSDKLEVRLGGIYALERISQESPQDHWTVMENLTAFVRERTQRAEADRRAKPLHQRVAEIAHSLWEEAGKPEGRSEEFWHAAVNRETSGEPPATDIAAVLTVIKRRSETHRAREIKDQRVLDFRQAVLRRADLTGAHLEGADLTFAHLEGAVCIGGRGLKHAISKAPNPWARISNAWGRISKAPTSGARISNAPC